jgi:hypothetical protein
MPKSKTPVSPKPRTVTKEFDAEAIAFGKERSALASLVIRLGESFRDDWFPGMSTWEALQLALIMLRMFHFHLTTGRAESASALSRATGMPRATVQRKLTTLKRMGFVKQHGVRFALDVDGLNQPKLLDGFQRRLGIVRGTLAKTLGNASFDRGPPIIGTAHDSAA